MTPLTLNNFVMLYYTGKDKKGSYWDFIEDLRKRLYITPTLKSKGNRGCSVDLGSRYPGLLIQSYSGMKRCFSTPRILPQ